MSMDSLDICRALDWYRTYLSAERGLSKRDIHLRVGWIEHFCDSLPRSRVAVSDITVREVVLYFADQSGDFQKPLEWYSRYKALESFWDDMVDADLLETNMIKGIYDDSDVEPYDEADAVVRAPTVPVNWSRAETVY